jgi:hypothetical protein
MSLWKINVPITSKFPQSSNNSATIPIFVTDSKPFTISMNPSNGDLRLKNSPKNTTSPFGPN